MKKYLTIIALILALAIVVIVVIDVGKAWQANRIGAYRYTTEASCTKVGGTWTPVPAGERFMGSPIPESHVCTFSTTDGGKRCLDSIQCQGQCMTGNPKNGFQLGRCSYGKYPAGCNGVVHFGWKSGLLCKE